MKNKISLNMARNFTESLLGLFHGTPAARAAKERAEATLKWLEAYERYWEFLGKVGYSEEDRKAFIAQDFEFNHVRQLQEISNLVDRKRVQFQIVRELPSESGGNKNR